MIRYIYGTKMLCNKRLALRTGSTIWRNIFSARPGPDLGFTRNRTGFSGGKLNAAIDSAAARTKTAVNNWNISLPNKARSWIDIKKWICYCDFLGKFFPTVFWKWWLPWWKKSELTWYYGTREMTNIPAYVDRAETSTMQKIWQSPALHGNNSYPCVKNDRNMFFVFSSCLLVSKTMSRVVDPD